ncbi:hypothetical protein MKY59_03940 [Paenibacillus sp. FSL W8-0426]|uniref:hypothetical protein n=1 Tax=Paenibacillus sp. FSL W8-0426 TaxID=2921714 RepID=UPI0030D9258F
MNDRMNGKLFVSQATWNKGFLRYTHTHGKSLSFSKAGIFRVLSMARFGGE